MRLRTTIRQLRPAISHVSANLISTLKVNKSSYSTIRKSILASGFSTLALVNTLTNASDESKFQFDKDLSLLLKGLSDKRLVATIIIDGTETTLLQLMELSKNDLDASLRLKNYICNQLIPQLDNDEFEILASKLFESHDIDYAKRAIIELKKRYQDGVNKIICNGSDHPHNAEKALYIAYCHGSRDVVDLLLVNGAKPYYTIIAGAVTKLDYELLERLFAYGADINVDGISLSEFPIKDFIKESPHLPIHEIEMKRAAIAKLLIKHGLDPLNALEAHVFSDMEIVKQILVRLDELGHDVYRETNTRYLSAYVLEEIQKLHPEQLTNPEPLRYFFKAISDRGYQFYKLEVLYAMSNAARRDNTPLTDLLAESILRSGLNPYDVMERYQMTKLDETIKDRMIAAFERQGKRLAENSNQPYVPFFPDLTKSQPDNETYGVRRFFNLFSPKKNPLSQYELVENAKSEADKTLDGYRRNLRD